MKVTLLNTYDITGGAAIACNRLLLALRANNADAKMLVQNKKKDNEHIISISNSFQDKISSFTRFSYERLTFALRERSKEVRYAFSPANAGIDISKHELIQNSDIIHLHWINQGYLSINSLHQLKKLNKPIVWTLHDMWAFTGGCHYSGTCHAYETECKNCPYLSHPAVHDLSNTVWKKKLSLFKDFNITFVTCSEWLRDIALKSALLKNFKIIAIPNPIDTEIFKPISKTSAKESLKLERGKKYILFGAMNTADKRKGFIYLLEALRLLKLKYPTTVQDIELLVFGKADDDLLKSFPYKVHNLGLLQSLEQIVTVYSASDLFVLPSLEDNLPNTIMESLSCGTPVVAFKTGGIPEMIDHKDNGYLAEYKSEKDLSEGIYWTLYSSDFTKLCEQSRKKSLANYTQKIVGEKYIALYKDIQ